MEVVLRCRMDIPGMLWHNITGMGGTNLEWFIQSNPEENSEIIL